MVVNPIAVFILEEGTDVEVQASGKTLTPDRVAAKEYRYTDDEENATLRRLDADAIYEVHIGDTHVSFDADNVRDRITFDF